MKPKKKVIIERTRKKDHTDNDEGSYNGNERNIRQGTLKRVSNQMLFESVASNTRKPRNQNARNNHIKNRHNHRQRRNQ